MPLISIVTSVYNESPSYLRSAIESILKQTLTNYEFIIIDDGSTEKVCQEILREFAERDSRIRLLTNPKNIGLTLSLNRGIAEAQGQFIARMDSDDIAKPDRLKSQLEFLQNGNYDLVGSNSILIDKVGETIKERHFSSPKKMHSALMKGNFFTHGTFFGKREIFRELYNEKYQRAQDYEFLLRILGKQFRLGFMEQPTLYFRINEKGLSSLGNHRQEWCALRARWDAITKYGFSWKYLPYLLRSLCILFIPYRWKKKIALTIQ